MSHNQFIDYCMSGIAGLTPYVPGKPIETLERELGISHSVKLASNENPLGASPKVQAVIADNLSDLSRYPDGSAYRLCNALAKKHQCTADMITIGNGSNDVLDMIARVFLGIGKEAIFSQYAFAVYPISTQATGAQSRITPASNFGYDLDAVLDQINDKTAVIFIANPNNPTGTWLTGDALATFLSKVPSHIIVVIDEAYVEYVEQAEYSEATTWLHQYANLIVTRTFSKAYGLAGLRIGYSICHPDIANLINRVRQPFNANSLALLAAETALSDEEYIKQSVKTNQQGMKQMTEGLSQLGIDYIPSVGNFICAEMPQDAAAINQSLLERGVIVRPVANYGLTEHLRISIGLEQENQRFLDTLSDIIK